ncbi:glycine cleavage system protein GcvH [Fusibacter sp. JL216-2]|uniref:glycine cleavage system protein GcvH n=1 Tax=Fusibacter sp. JL216-2 TaxID=3071453 RepID=UPI003D358A5F
MKIVQGLFYSEDHEWVKVEGNKAKIGITDYAQHQMGDIVYVELPEEDDELEAGESFGVIESVKAASDSFSPVTGTVTAVNEDIEDDYAVLNEDPYENWILEVELSDASELDKLMDAQKYEAFTSEEA